MDSEKKINKKKIECMYCEKKFSHSSGLSRHIKNCTERDDPVYKLNKLNEELIKKDNIINELHNKYNEILLKQKDHSLELKNIIINKDTEIKKIMIDKEKEIKKVLIDKENEIKKITTEKENELKDLFKSVLNKSNVLLNKSNDTIQKSTEALKIVSTNAIKYANSKYKDAPVLKKIENFDINGVNYKTDKETFIEILIEQTNRNKFEKLLGDHIVSVYKTNNPEEQSIHTTDCSRLNYIVKQLIIDANDGSSDWKIDKTGIMICSKIIKPLVNKCLSILEKQFYKLTKQLDYVCDSSFCKKYGRLCQTLYTLHKSDLEGDINKYIAPYFNLMK